ncbi:MAG: 4-hydroxy-tetrahydrodipicolinate reductase [Magnetococcus sp. DMHC-6]
MPPIKIGIVGGAGRMGCMLVQAIQVTPACCLVAVSERPQSERIGQDAGEVASVGKLGIPIVEDPLLVFELSQVVIDFTQPSATLAHLEYARRYHTPMVIGTTGLDGYGRARIEEASREVPIVFAPNYSVGVNLLFKVAADVARVLGMEYDIEIIEAHHRHKVDAPSGTALGLGEAIADALDRRLEDVAVYCRQGHTGARDRQTIGFATIRGGDIVGDHTALFAGDGERLELTHRASSRMTFARGAVRAALWVTGQSGPGLFDMRDILGLR